MTNNSYYVDPWMFNCKDDLDQGAIVDAVGRAAKYAENKGVVNVAAAGNSNMDLAAAQLTDTSSPNDSTPVSRTIDRRSAGTSRPSFRAPSRWPRPASRV